MNHLITETLNHSLIVLILSLLRIRLRYYLYYILILQLVVDTTSLRRMLGRFPPHHGEIEIPQHLCWNILAQGLNGCALTNCGENDRLGQVGLVPFSLGVNPRQAQVIPNHRLSRTRKDWENILSRYTFRDNISKQQHTTIPSEDHPLEAQRYYISFSHSRLMSAASSPADPPPRW